MVKVKVKNAFILQRVRESGVLVVVKTITSRLIRHRCHLTYNKREEKSSGRQSRERLGKKIQRKTEMYIPMRPIHRGES